MAREFIPNITTANEEIVRLDALVATAAQTQLDLTKAQGDLVAAQALLDAAIKPEALQAAVDGKKKADDDLAAAVIAHAAAIKDLQAKVDASGLNSVKAAAAAGVAPVVDGKTTGVDLADDAKAATQGLTGLARAIAGNVALQAANSGK